VEPEPRAEGRGAEIIFPTGAGAQITNCGYPDLFPQNKINFWQSYHYPDSKFQNAVRIQIQIYMAYGTYHTMLTKETGKGFT
jgi:hypothetical protein